MKHWKETLIKSENIKWTRPRVKTIKDGKLDFILTVPVTSLFESQARQSFAEGMIEMLKFHIYHDAKPIEFPEIVKLFGDCGLPEVAKALNKYGAHRHSFKNGKGEE